MTTRDSIKRTIKTSIIGIFCVSIFGFGLFKAQNVIQGATLTLFPPSYSTSTPSLVYLSGKAKNTSFLSMNGRKIFTNEGGDFREQLLLSSGYNIIQVEAVDRFGKKETKKVELIYKPS
jgi:Glucodextranase, domain B